MTPTGLESLFELALALNQQNDCEHALQIVARHAANALQAESALILLINPQTRQSVKTVVREGFAEAGLKHRHIHDQLCGWILENRQPLLAANLANDMRFPSLRLGELKCNAAAGVPLAVEKILLGAMLVLNHGRERLFTVEEVSYLERVAVIAAPYLRNAQKIRDYFESPLPQAALLAKFVEFGLLGKSQAFINVLKAVESAARCDVRVVLEGRNGTGKGLLARAIHAVSARQDKPFKAVDCGAIPENLIESELFGHVKGAFTGAIKDRKGLLLEAHGGTLFLDEINNLPLSMQVKLLRALQDHEVRPLGSNDVQKINVRLIVAASVSLKQLVEHGAFREDLYYRLNVFPLRVPALAERKEDIPMLANAFLQKFAEQQNKRAAGFHEELTDFLKLRPWPGNVRELENFVERLVALTPAAVEIITPALLPDDLKEEFHRFDFNDLYATTSLAERVEAFERSLILRALTKHNWKQSKAARELKISPQALRYKLEKLKIDTAS